MYKIQSEIINNNVIKMPLETLCKWLEKFPNLIQCTGNGELITIILVEFENRTGKSRSKQNIKTSVQYRREM